VSFPVAGSIPRSALASAALAILCTATATADDSTWVRTRVIERLNEGVRLLRSGDPAAAAERLCWVADRALNAHEGAWLCGRALLESRQSSRAIEYLELASDIDPSHLRTWVTLGDAYLSDGQVDRARAAFFEALEVRSDYSPAYDGLARLAWQQGNYERALEIFAQALKANPADGRARLNRGRLHLEKGRVEQALGDIREAVRLRPDDGEVQLGLARVLFASGLTEGALAAARESSEILPLDSRPLALRARIQLAVGEISEAERVARRALEIDEHSVAARLVLGEALGRSARLDEAMLALTPPDPTLLSEREASEIDTRREHWRRRKEALDELEAATDRGGSPPEAIALLARARLELGNEAGAIALATEAVAKAPGDLEISRQAAYVLGAAGRPLAAERLLSLIVESSVASPDDLMNLGIARELSGDPAGARAAYLEALLGVAAPADAHLGLARLALRDGDESEARRSLIEYLAAETDDTLVLRIREALSRLPERAPDGGDSE